TSVSMTPRHKTPGLEIQPAGMPPERGCGAASAMELIAASPSPSKARAMETPVRSQPRTSTPITIRPMTEGDVPELLRLMHAIVSFERGQNFRLDEAELHRRGFGERPEFGAYVADAGVGALAGMAVHYEIPFMHTLQPLLMLKWL